MAAFHVKTKNEKIAEDINSCRYSQFDVNILQIIFLPIINRNWLSMIYVVILNILFCLLTLLIMTQIRKLRLFLFQSLFKSFRLYQPLNSNANHNKFYNRLAFRLISCCMSRLPTWAYISKYMSRKSKYLNEYFFRKTCLLHGSLSKCSLKCKREFAFNHNNPTHANQINNTTFDQRLHTVLTQ